MLDPSLLALVAGALLTGTIMSIVGAVLGVGGLRIATTKIVAAGETAGKAVFCRKCLGYLAGVAAMIAVLLADLFGPAAVRGTLLTIGFVGGWAWLTWRTWWQVSSCHSVRFVAGKVQFAGKLYNSPHDEERTHEVIFWLVDAMRDLIASGHAPRMSLTSLLEEFGRLQEVKTETETQAEKLDQIIATVARIANKEAKSPASLPVARPVARMATSPGRKTVRLGPQQPAAATTLVQDNRAAGH